MSGPAPKPTRLKILEGNPGKRPYPVNEPKPQPVAPPMPAWLPPIAKDEWKRLAPPLVKLGLLTEVDGNAFASYCLSWSDLVAAYADIKANGLIHVTVNGYETARPVVAAVAKAKAEILACGAQFGLTPSSRSRLNLPGKSDDDGFDGLLD